MRLIRCFSFGKVSNSRSVDSLDWKLKDKGKIVRRVLKDVKDGDIIFPSLTVKFIKTPLKALFYLGFSAVSFRFTI